VAKREALGCWEDFYSTEGAKTMIKSTKWNQAAFYINPGLIEFIEETADTVVTLTTGLHVNVEEPAGVLIDRIVEYRRRCYLERPFLERPEH
jgi:flagellar protein FlbD